MSKIWMFGCYVALMCIPVLCYWHIRWGALSALTAIAFAHIASLKKAEELNYLTQTSLHVLLEHTTALHKKIDNLERSGTEVTRIREASA